MSTLHLINNTSASLYSCLRVAQEDSALLLMEDGVLAVIRNSESSQKIISYLIEHPVYVLEPDLKARGVTRTINGIKKIDYDGFVRLTVTYSRVNSWM